MAVTYPGIVYKGQYTLKRVLTMPVNNAAGITIADIGKLVTVNAAGEVIKAPADATFFGILRSFNANDNVATVDFSGVHEFTASGAIDAGTQVIPAGAGSVKAGAGISVLVTLTQAADGEDVAVFFLN